MAVLREDLDTYQIKLCLLFCFGGSLLEVPRLQIWPALRLMHDRGDSLPVSNVGSAELAGIESCRQGIKRIT